MKELSPFDKTTIIENIVKLKTCINIELNTIIEDICPGYTKSEVSEMKSIDIIINTVCNYFHITKTLLITPREVKGSGAEELIRMRQIISFISYNDYGYSANEIGKSLLRGHPTILNSKKRAVNFYDTELAFKIDVDNCRKLIARKYNR